MSLNALCSNNETNKFLPEVYLSDLKTDSLVLKNSVPSYTGSNLNYYEQTQKLGINITGFSTTQTTGIEITRIGNLVSINVPEKIAVSNGNPIVLQNAIDLRFRPVVNLNFVPIVVDSIAQATPPNQINGHVDLETTTGNLIFYRTANELSFNNTATAGYRTLNFSYLV
jgi:hypothetical protein